MNKTQLTIKNITDYTVKVYLTLGAAKGCIEKVQEVPMVKNIINNKQGWFNLDSKKEASYTPPDNKGFNGNITFNTEPLNCPNNDFPSGINLAEFMLNNSFQNGNPQETIDISGVAGTNAYIEFLLDGGDNWNAGSNNPNVTKFSNLQIGYNKGQIGVYPYKCDDCTKSTNPPSCCSKPRGAPASITPQESAICNVQRNATESGGTVTISYKGDATLMSTTTAVTNFEFDNYTGNKHFAPQANGWRKYCQIPTNKNGGAQISAGSFDSVDIYCEKQEWNWNGNNKTQTPLGTGSSSWPERATGPTYPDAFRWGVVLCQVSTKSGKTLVTYHQVTATELNKPQTIKLDPNIKNIYIAVNDGVNNYNDNSDDFSVCVKFKSC